MAKIISNYTLTFDPAGAAVVLVAVGDKMEGELQFGTKMGVEVIEIIDAPNVFIRPYGNRVTAIKLSVYLDYGSDLLARAEVLNSIMAIGPTRKKPLKIEVAGITDAYWQFANAAIESYEPARWLDAPVARMVKSYSIQATGLTRVGP